MRGGTIFVRDISYAAIESRGDRKKRPHEAPSFPDTSAHDGDTCGYRITRLNRIPADVLDGLLLPAVVGRPTLSVSRRQGNARAEHLHVGQDLEARHVLLQRQVQLLAYDHQPE